MANEKEARNLSYVFDKEEGEKIWFTSDTHFHHENIIHFCNRPFGSVEEMNTALIENWNKKVKPNDIVFHLGDFCWGGASKWCDILSRLNGKIVLAKGNHDEKNLADSVKMLFEKISYQYYIRIDGQPIYINHYPFLCYGGQNRGIWQVYGHVHTLSSSNPAQRGKDAQRVVMAFPTQYDVGVDGNDYAPISFAELREKIRAQIEMAKDSEK